MSFQNWHKEFDKIWIQYSKVSKIYTLISWFWLKHITFELKKYRRVIFFDSGEWCKIWRKTNLWFAKWNEEFGKFSPQHSKVSKLGLCWNPLIQSRKFMSLIFTKKLCAMTTKNDAKFEERFHCQLKLDMKNLANFYPST